jgi:gamma-glutamylcyclotransferase (GGCT)/AIG2-like uncharacterized protein YtfP
MELLANSARKGHEYADELVSSGKRVREACVIARIGTSSYYRWRDWNIIYVFFYGSLRRGEEGYIELSLDRYLEFYAEDAVAGSLYDLGPYPGLKPSKGQSDNHVKGELFLIRDRKVLPLLDEFERYVPKGDSTYLRRVVTTALGRQRAWAYFSKGPLRRKPLIETGDWLEYKSGARLG